MLFPKLFTWQRKPHRMEALSMERTFHSSTGHYWKWMQTDSSGTAWTLCFCGGYLGNQSHFLILWTSWQNTYLLCALRKILFYFIFYCRDSSFSRKPSATLMFLITPQFCRVRWVPTAAGKVTRHFELSAHLSLGNTLVERFLSLRRLKNNDVCSRLWN